MIAAGFAIRFAWPGLAPLKIAAFLGLEGTMLAWLGLLVVAVLPPREAVRPGGHGVGGRTTSSRPLSSGEIASAVLRGHDHRRRPAPRGEREAVCPHRG